MTGVPSRLPFGLRRVQVVSVCIALLVCNAASGQAAPTVRDLDSVRAAFLFNLSRFVQWPSAVGPLVICTLGDDPAGDRVRQLAPSQFAGERPFEARRLLDHDSPAGCHLLFVPESRNRVGLELLERAKALPVVTVGETVQFFRAGGMVRLFIEQNRPRFQVDRAAAEARGLKFSSRLLTLAAP